MREVAIQDVPDSFRAYLSQHSVIADFVASVNSIATDGQTLTAGCIIVKETPVDDLPEFAEISGLYVVNGESFLLVKLLSTVEYDEHLHVFIVSRTEEELVLRSLDIESDMLNLHRTRDGRLAVNPRHALL